MIFEPRKKGIGSENFIKLTSGQSVTVALKGKPVKGYIHWVEKRSYECTGKGCSRCVGTERGSFRFKINVVTIHGDALEAKIFEGGSRSYDMLAELNSKFDFTKTLLQISRFGEGKQTQYVFAPLVTQQIAPQLAARIAAVKELPLEADTKHVNAQEVVEEMEDAPF